MEDAAGSPPIGVPSLFAAPKNREVPWAASPVGVAMVPSAFLGKTAPRIVSWSSFGNEFKYGRSDLLQFWKKFVVFCIELGVNL